MISLSLAILCSVGLAQFLKLASLKSCPRFPLYAVNYAAAFMLGIIISDSKSTGEPIASILLAILIGILFITGLVVFQHSIQLNGTGLSITASRLSVVLPILVSITVFGETAGVAGAAGIIIAILVLPFSGKNKIFSSRKENNSGLFWSILLFLIFGVNDSALKIRNELIPGSDSGTYFAVLFATSMIIAVIISLARRERFTVNVFLIGIPLGAVNYGTVFFLAEALEEVSGYTAFTVNSVGIILIGLIIGRLLWGERLQAHNYIFVAGSIPAVILIGSTAASS
jgi:drug/metabolite transporter (DMT)-like permease